MNFKLYVQLFNIISTFCFKQPIPFADSSLSKQGIHKIAIPGNEDVAVWWSMKDQKWNAVHDMCPHRQASLSLGVVNPKTNDIKCPYHGIEFDGCGKCTLIPSSNYNKNIFSVKKYYIKEKYNLLWIFENLDIELPTINILEKSVKFPWSIYKIDCSNKLLIENLFDTLHLSSVHHGMIPGVLDRYKPMDVFLSETNWFNETGFSCNIYNKKSDYPVHLLFINPFYTFVNFPNSTLFTINFPNSTIFTINIDIDKNKSLHISTYIIKVTSILEKNILDFIINIFKPILFFLSKITFEQDRRILMSQSANLLKYDNKYTPSNSADLPITLYNKWLKKYGGQEQS